MVCPRTGVGTLQNRKLCFRRISNLKFVNRLAGPRKRWDQPITVLSTYPWRRGVPRDGQCLAHSPLRGSSSGSPQDRLPVRGVSPRSSLPAHPVENKYQLVRLLVSDETDSGTGGSLQWHTDEWCGKACTRQEQVSSLACASSSALYRPTSSPASNFWLPHSQAARRGLGSAHTTRRSSASCPRATTTSRPSCITCGAPARENCTQTCI
jgi:hypothetical protein